MNKTDGVKSDRVSAWFVFSRRRSSLVQSEEIIEFNRFFFDHLHLDPDSLVSSPTVRRRATSRTALVSPSQSLSPSSPPAQILVAQQSDGSPTGYLC